ncbi:hypothetical protein [Massilia sp. TS11]|uniref:hypothetical protein n=1 Tax=Massilia sp. TS11 TaxID=2908003 RepID=UPI001EDB36DA|nr:hypothetical protein [Massilia sp. TS11]MCG2583023.1 hypothetical protein [Massilia sp. TS11]
MNKSITLLALTAALLAGSAQACGIEQMRAASAGQPEALADMIVPEQLGANADRTPMRRQVAAAFHALGRLKDLRITSLQQFPKQHVQLAIEAERGEGTRQMQVMSFSAQSSVLGQVFFSLLGYPDNSCRLYGLHVISAAPKANTLFAELSRPAVQASAAR